MKTQVTKTSCGVARVARPTCKCLWFVKARIVFALTVRLFVLGTVLHLLLTVLLFTVSTDCSRRFCALVPTLCAQHVARPSAFAPAVAVSALLSNLWRAPTDPTTSRRERLGAEQQRLEVLQVIRE